MQLGNENKHWKLKKINNNKNCLMRHRKSTELHFAET